MVILFAQVFMLALVNLLIISWYERDMDLKNDQMNLATIISGNFGIIILSLMCLHIFLSVIILTNGPFFSSQVVFALMWIVFLIVWLRQDYFSKQERYSTFVDGAFFLPILILLF